MAQRPSPNGANGESDRDRRGRFRVGHPGGPGNPKGAVRARMWHEWMECVEVEHVRRVYRVILERALAGDMEACRIFLDRTLGKVAEQDLEQPSNTQRLFEMIDEADRAMVAEAAAKVNRMTAEALGVRDSTKPTG